LPPLTTADSGCAILQRHDVAGKADDTKKHAMTDAQHKIEEKK